MRLSTMAGAVSGAKISAGEDPEIEALCYDSRVAAPGSVFFAVRGGGVDGHDFIGSALEAGASAVVAQREDPDGKVPWVKVPDSRAAMSAMAKVFFGHPSLSMKVVGVTGTNGKTTTALILHYLLNAAHRRCGMLGTVHYDLGGEFAKATHTTPESSDLQRYLAAMVDNGCHAAAMEVSSHALDQGRAADVEFDAAVFTNLTRDHLDYHGDMASYFAAKRMLFEQMASQTEKTASVAAINLDDTWGKKLLQRFPAGGTKPVSYGFGVGADYRAFDLRQDRDGIDFKLEVKGRQMRARIPLIGRFNVYNAVGALVAAVGMGLNLRETVGHLADLPQVPGRLESVSSGRAFHVYVDYAHTPDALENALETLRALDPRRIILVFGCGGERDMPKRAQMGAVAERLANYSIITSDNPRSEDPEAIIRDIESGFDGDIRESITDRREAIAAAISYVAPGDIVLIAGKGHEDYQQLADKTIEFDDRVVARQMLGDRDRSRDDMVREIRAEYEAREQERAERAERRPYGREEGGE